MGREQVIKGWAEQLGRGSEAITTVSGVRYAITMQQNEGGFNIGYRPLASSEQNPTVVRATCLNDGLSRVFNKIMHHSGEKRKTLATGSKNGLKGQSSGINKP